MSQTPQEIAHYFAYGSNHNPLRMTERGVTFTDRQPASLPGYQFRLNKRRLNGTVAANIQENSTETVHGVLYTCTPDVFEKLDRFEGVKGGHYARVPVTVMCGGTPRVAITYVACANRIADEICKVETEYLEHILCGRDLLPPDYVVFLETFRSWCV